MSGTHLYVVAGEPSGDQHAAAVLEALREIRPEVVARGLGGPALAAAGMRLEEDLASRGIMGLFPVLRALPWIRRVFAAAERSLDEHRPAAVLLVDYPGFNLRFAASARRRGIPVIQYVSPQVWAWARWRIRRIARLVDLMLVILPFEEQVYAEAGLTTRYVGHPLDDHLARHPLRGDRVRDLTEFRGDGPLLALFPGSRRHVVDSLWPSLQSAVEILRREPAWSGTKVVVGLAQEGFREAIPAAFAADPRVRVVVGETQEAMAAADLCLTTSGTTTLEIAGRGTPFVLGYRVSPLVYLLGRCLLAVPYIGLVNLVAGRALVPECVHFRPLGPALAGHAARLLGDPAALAAQRRGLADVRARLGGPGSYRRTAAALDAFLAGRRPEPSCANPALG